MQFGISHKLGTLTALLLVAVGGIVGKVVWDLSVDLLIEHEKVDLRDESRLKGEEIKSVISTMREDVLALSAHPAIYEIIEHKQAGEIDQAALNDARGRLAQAFTAVCEGEPGKEEDDKYYLQVRFIGKDDGGREIVRVQRDVTPAGRNDATGEMTKKQIDFSSVTFESLDDPESQQFVKGDRPYFANVQMDFEAAGGDIQEKLAVRLSEVEFNIEQDPDTGQAIISYDDDGNPIPVLRASMPVLDRDGEFFGIVIINLDFSELHDDLLTSPRHLVYLTNNQGQFLVHPRHEREFSHAKRNLPEFKKNYDGDELDDRLQSSSMFSRHWSEYYHDPDPVALRAAAKGDLADETVRPAVGIRLKRLQISPEFDFSDADESDWNALLNALRQLHLDPDNRVAMSDPERLAKGMSSFAISAPLDDETALDQLENVQATLISAVGSDKLKEQYTRDCRDFFATFVLLRYNPQDADQWLGLIMAFSEDELHADISSTWTKVFFSGALCVAGGILLVVLIAHMLTRRLKQVTRASERIAEGNFDVKLPLDRRDEIGDLARGFEHMISEVQSREQKIEEREARLSTILEKAAEGIITVDVDGEIRSANSAAMTMFGGEQGQVSGKPVHSLLAEESRDAFDAARRRLLEDASSQMDIPVFSEGETLKSLRKKDRKRATSVSMECVGRRSDGTEFPLELSLSSVRLPERRIFTLIARDITERKEAEQEIYRYSQELQRLNEDLEKRVADRTAELEHALIELRSAHEKTQELSRAKDAFLASVSHELRNPLNQVSGFCQLLELGDLDEEQRDDVRKIRVANSQLLALINDILDYQKIIMGGLTLEPEDVDVEVLLGEVRDAMSVQANENNNQLYFEWSDDVGHLLADKQRLRQVLLNLVGNACKFTRDGSVSVMARRCEGGGNSWIEIDVKDTGRGMTTEELGKLFRPFMKLASRQGNKSGTGLGLVISKGFCELMRGDIRVDSEFGAGTTFTVRLPASSDDAIPGAAPREPAPTVAANINEPESPEPDGVQAGHDRQPESAAPPAEDPGRLVLVIDDDFAVREMMERHLVSHGFRVVTAANGFDGLEKARKLRPAVITLDAIMPELDGWAVLGALKASEDTCNIPVVMVTVMDKEDRGLALGATEFLPKPIDWDRLADTLSRFTGDKREKSILVVDDDAATREILRRNLEGDGWSVLEAENGAAALETLATIRPAAVLLDLMMPVMDGFEFIVNYSQVAEWLSIPVLVLTAKDPTSAERERLEGQVVRVLRKGDYTHEELLAEIHRRVDSHLIKSESSNSQGAADGEDSDR